MNSLYIRKFFNPQIKSSTLTLVDGIKLEFERMLDKITWMDNATKSEAYKKIYRMQSITAFPDEFLNDTALIEHHQNLSIDESNFFETILRLEKFNFDQAFDQLHEPINKTDWLSYAKVAIVNAFYRPMENTIREYEIINQAKC